MYKKPLPEFARPPIVEVAVSVRFDRPTINGPLIMLRWSQIRDRFPKYEEAPPAPLLEETLDRPRAPRFELRISDALPTSRLFMKSESETEILQIQEDMLGYSWRKLSPTDEYPHFARIITGFKKELSEFEEFLSEENIGSVAPVQCEVTYVNLILPGEIWSDHSELGKIVPSAGERLSEGFLPPPEHSRYFTQYAILDDDGLPRGKLHVSIEPGRLMGEDSPMYLMTLTARGAPKDERRNSVISTMDIGHEWIVRGFTTLTSTEMHKEWGRIV